MHAGCSFINEMTFRLSGKVNGIMSGGGTCTQDVVLLTRFLSLSAV